MRIQKAYSDVRGHQSEFTKQGYRIAGLATKDLDKKPFAINNNTLVINT